MFPWHSVVSNMHNVEFGFKIKNWCRFHHLITRLILWFSMLLVWVSSVEALSMRNSPGAVILKEDPKADCRLITTRALNMPFYLFSSANGGIMSWNLQEHVLRHLFSTLGNFSVTQGSVSKQSCGAIAIRLDLIRRSVGVDRCLRHVNIVICFGWPARIVSFLLLGWGCRYFTVLADCPNCYMYKPTSGWRLSVSVGHCRHYIIISESLFSPYHTDGRARVPRRQCERLIDAWFQPTHGNHGPSVVVWVAIHHGGKSNMVILDGTTNRHRFSQILRDCILPLPRGVFGWNFVIGQDSAPPHVARDTVAFLDQHVEFIDRPAMSPDMNPIEQIWDQMSTWIRDMDRPPWNRAELQPLKFRNGKVISSHILLGM